MGEKEEHVCKMSARLLNKSGWSECATVNCCKSVLKDVVLQYHVNGWFAFYLRNANGSKDKKLGAHLSNHLLIN